MSGKLFIISAPSGAGKTTLVKHALKRLNLDHAISRVVTYTTKTPREKEAVHGQDFYFISQAEFEQKITQGYFIEWSNAYGNYYGSPASIVEHMVRGESLIIILDRAGALQIKEKIPEAVLIWIYTSSIAVLRNRLEARASEVPEQVESRLRLAEKEIQAEDMHPRYQFHILNDDFYESLDNLCNVFNKILKKTV